MNMKKLQCEYIGVISNSEMSMLSKNINNPCFPRTQNSPVMTMGKSHSATMGGSFLFQESDNVV